MHDTTNPVSVAARLGGPHPTAELTLAASAVVPTPGGSAVLLTLEQVQELMDELEAVVQFHARVPAAPASTRYLRARQRGAALPDDFPRGPWYPVATGTDAEAGTCLLCGDTIHRQAATFFRLVDGTGGWENATMHVRCARVLRVHRFRDLDLIGTGRG